MYGKNISVIENKLLSKAKSRVLFFIIFHTTSTDFSVLSSIPSCESLHRGQPNCSAHKTVPELMPFMSRKRSLSDFITISFWTILHRDDCVFSRLLLSTMVAISPFSASFMVKTDARLIMGSNFVSQIENLCTTSTVFTISGFIY